MEGIRVGAVQKRHRRDDVGAADGHVLQLLRPGGQGIGDGTGIAGAAADINFSPACYQGRSLSGGRSGEFVSPCAQPSAVSSTVSSRSCMPWKNWLMCQPSTAAWEMLREKGRVELPVVLRELAIGQDGEEMGLPAGDHSGVAGEVQPGDAGDAVKIPGLAALAGFMPWTLP